MFGNSFSKMKDSFARETHQQSDIADEIEDEVSPEIEDEIENEIDDEIIETDPDENVHHPLLDDDQSNIETNKKNKEGMSQTH